MSDTTRDNLNVPRESIHETRNAKIFPLLWLEALMLDLHRFLRRFEAVGAQVDLAGCACAAELR